MTATRQFALGFAMGGAAKPSLPPVLLPFAPLHKRAMGVAIGVVAGGVLWLATAILLLKGGYPVGPMLGLLGQFLYGYSVTWAGSFIGLLWGFVLGFVAGWCFAALRNGIFRLWLKLIYWRAEIDNSNILDHM